MNIYVVRHGETNYNVLGLSNDDPRKDVHLTQKGKEQSEDVANILRDVPINHIYISQLKRTRETAEIINKHHGVPILEDARINDRRTGFEGKKSILFEEAVKEDPIRIKPDGGESFLEEKFRVHLFLENLHAQSFKTVLIVTHSEIMKIINGHYRNMSDREMWELSFGNCEILRF